MTNHRAGRSNTRDPRGNRWGKRYKASTNRVIRRLTKLALGERTDGK